MRTWRIVAAAALASAPSVVAGDFAVGSRGLAVAAGASLLCAGLALFYRMRRPEPRIAATLSAVARVLVVSAAAGVMSYTVAARGGPLWDGTFAGLGPGARRHRGGLDPGGRQAAIGAKLQSKPLDRPAF